MPLYEVAILSVPSPKEVEEGKTEDLIVPPTAIVARDEQSAIAAVAGNHMKSTVQADPNRTRVLVRPFA
jgi:hypothetical protein